VDVVTGAGRPTPTAWATARSSAGLIAGQPRAGVGFSGVAPGVKILPVRQTTGTDGTAQTLADGIRAGVDGGATVINVSITVAARRRCWRAPCGTPLAAARPGGGRGRKRR